MKPQTRFPSTVYNIISLVGLAVALFGLAAILILYVLSSLGGSNPYLGIVMLVVLPAIMVVGLLLIPVGMWRERQLRLSGRRKALIINVAKRGHRNAIITFGVGTSIFLFLTTIGMFETYEFTESSTFCGEVCHTTMAPEYTAWHESPHARVGCVDCHVGEGFDWFVKAKISGVRQVWQMVNRSWPTPIPTPIHDLRPARETCEHCHWPGKSYASKEIVRDYFLGDEANTHWRIRLLLHVGETSTQSGRRAWGIHWHVDPRNRVEYVAGDDKRLSVSQVTWWQNGEPVVYSETGQPLSPDEIVEAELEGRVRTMDCIDCHNRPAHVYLPPTLAVNGALSHGALDRDLPFAKREAVRALSAAYGTRDAGRDSIRTVLERVYADIGIDVPQSAVAAVIDLYERNMFPEMGVRWNEYPVHNSHMESPGCFRCHGSNLRNAAGERIRDDCDLCHKIIAQGPVEDDHEFGPSHWTGVDEAVTGVEFEHPISIDGAQREMRCWECHSGDDSIYLEGVPTIPNAALTAEVAP